MDDYRKVKASELFEAMGNHDIISVFGTQIDIDEKIRDDWEEAVAPDWFTGRIISMAPGTRGGVRWIIKMKSTTLEYKTWLLYVLCNEK